MRSYKEIQADIDQAIRTGSSRSLRALAAEMQALETPEAVASALQTMGVVYANTGAYSEALEHFRRALVMHEELGNRTSAAGVTGNMGNVFAMTGDYPRALEQLRRALQVHEELGDRAGAALVTSSIGTVYYSTSAYPEALEYYRRALAVHEELGDRANATISTVNMGSVYASTKAYPEALEHFHRALTVYENEGNRAGAALVTGNMGTVYADTEAYPEALEHFHRALAMHKELDDRASAALVTGNLVTAHMELEQYDEAAELLEHQESLLMDDPVVRARHLANQALLAEHRGNLEAAHSSLVEALAISTEAGLRSESAEFHEKLRNLAQKRNDFAAYIEHNNEYQRITEEISGKEATQKIAMMEAERKMEAERQERERERAVLYSTLPKDVADRVIRGEDVSGDEFDHASVLFLDIAGFTTHSHDLNPKEVTDLLDQVFDHFDEICDRHGVTKVKTIGDAYLAVAFGEAASTEQRAASAASGAQSSEHRAASAALEMLASEFYWPTATANSNSNQVQFRIGLHSGPVVAGVIGKQRLQYDVWGDTVNVASRMESTGERGRIQVSSEFYEQLSSRDTPSHSLERGASEGGGVRFRTTERGTIDVKGKGSMTTYWLEGADA